MSYCTGAQSAAQRWARLLRIAECPRQTQTDGQTLLGGGWMFASSLQHCPWYSDGLTVHNCIAHSLLARESLGMVQAKPNPGHCGSGHWGLGAPHSARFEQLSKQTLGHCLQHSDELTGLSCIAHGCSGFADQRVSGDDSGFVCGRLHHTARGLRNRMLPTTQLCITALCAHHYMGCRITVAVWQRVCRIRAEQHAGHVGLPRPCPAGTRSLPCT